MKVFLLSEYHTNRCLGVFYTAQEADECARKNLNTRNAGKFWISREEIGKEFNLQNEESFILDLGFLLVDRG